MRHRRRVVNNYSRLPWLANNRPSCHNPRMNIETLRDRITRDGRTLTEIARVSGVGLRTLNRIVNERANPMMETVQRIEVALKRGKRN